MAGSGQRKNVRLSKNLSQMKFMQRRSRKDAEEELETEKQRQIDDTHWYLDLPELISKGNRYETVDSLAECEEFICGRMSFKGMNPAIEKFMENLEAEADEDDEDDEGAEQVSDEEMAERYSTLVGTVGKMFTKKRNRSQTEDDIPMKKKHKRAFLKPPDE
ncbi:M-phase phosphoprotein 6-like [Diadema setosum]|uniref:M-phase phosphoprotein 6-like n=1 Tax=Diadema setosum TaxID=31175 RepID=UPI003B3A27CD